MIIRMFYHFFVEDNQTCILSLHIKAPSFYPWPDYDAVLHENTCIIGLCELISASLDSGGRPIPFFAIFLSLR